MDTNKLLEILDYLDVEDYNKPINCDDLYVKIFGTLPDDCSNVSACVAYDLKYNTTVTPKKVSIFD